MLNFLPPVVFQVKLFMFFYGVPSVHLRPSPAYLYYTPWNGRFFMWYKGHLLVSDVNIKLENSAVEKRSQFPALVDLHRFIGNCSLSAIPSIPSLFGIKPVSMSTKIVPRQGLKWRIEDVSRRLFLTRVGKGSCSNMSGTSSTIHFEGGIPAAEFQSLA